MELKYNKILGGCDFKHNLAKHSTVKHIIFITEAQNQDIKQILCNEIQLS
jgi:hypothetical protein